jgi:predicted transport protein
MNLFSIKQKKLQKIKEIPLKDEKEIQILTEYNSKDVLGLEMVKSEFAVGNLRIDTLAFDNESKSFVIIEYKKDKNFSVIDQGYAYLALLLNNKADFVLEYNESMNKNIKKNEIDWSQSKVIFISSQFTKYQKEAISFKDLPIQLYEISKFENGSILFNDLKPLDTNESINKISEQSGVIKEISKEIKVYIEEDHLKDMPKEIIELYKEIKNRILEIDENIKIKHRKYYISFISATNFVDIHLQHSQIKLWINLKKGKLDDPKKIMRDVSAKGHWGNGDYEIVLKPGDNLDYLISLVKQSYNENT